jgi:hypothetical protein
MRKVRKIRPGADRTRLKRLEDKIEPISSIGNIA